MNRLLACLVFLTAILAACDRGPRQESSDFAVLARAAEGYDTAVKGHSLRFPRDHGSHPGFRIEWWYLTANLKDLKGQRYGAQWTLFRTAVQPSAANTENKTGNNSQVFMAHFALTHPGGHQSWQRYARGGSHGVETRAGVTAQPFAAWLDDWELASLGKDWLPMQVTARQDQGFFKLELSSDQEPVLQGERGFSQKHSSGGGSYYYSQPFLQARGEINLDGESIPVSGEAWLDHEWSSQFLQPDQVGWDWFALHLENGEKLMLFRLRARPKAEAEAFLHGVLISPKGSTQQLDPEVIQLRVLKETLIAGRKLPLHWHVSLPSIQREFEVTALLQEQWMDVDFPYWEGAVQVNGDGPQNRGRGYLELTGYPLK